MNVIIISSMYISMIIVVCTNFIWLLGFCLMKIFRHQTLKYAPFGWASLGLPTVFLVLVAYGLGIGAWNLKIKEVTYCNALVPASFDGMRIAHISDLNLGESFDLLSPDQLKRYIDAVNSTEPDLICFTGDLVTWSVEEAQPYAEVLKSLKSRHGVISVLGDHDLFKFVGLPRDSLMRKEEARRLAEYERDSLGWTLLRNSSKVITRPYGSTLTVIGVDSYTKEDVWGSITNDYGDLPKAMENTDGFRILLSHDPNHWDSEVLGRTDIPLTLSGHTLGGEIMGLLPVSSVFKRIYGRYDEGGQTLIVNPGLCVPSFGRLGHNPEITIITLKRK